VKVHNVPLVGHMANATTEVAFVRGDGVADYAPQVFCFASFSIFVFIHCQPRFFLSLLNF
jgi:hypothetical protein